MFKQDYWLGLFFGTLWLIGVIYFFVDLRKTKIENRVETLRYQDLREDNKTGQTQKLIEDLKNSPVPETNYDNDYEPVDYELTSDNWDCTHDCSGHEAGYEWAEENGITDPSDCGGYSQSFIEGCWAWANENEGL